MLLKLRWVHEGRHSQCTLFVGNPEQTMVNIGTLCMNQDEAIVFRQTVRQGIQGEGFTGILESGWKAGGGDE